LHKRRIRRSPGEMAFDGFNVLFMILLCVIMIYPFWYVMILAFNTGADAQYGGIYVWPRVFTLENFVYVFKYQTLRSAAVVTVARCLVSSVFGVSICMMTAFSLSKTRLPGRRAIIIFFMIPMFIGGTVVSNYIVMAKLKLINNFLVFVLPGAFSYFTAVVMRSFIDNQPIELQESALMDGANNYQIFFRIIVPLAKATIAAFLFFAVVGNWLDVTTNVLYITKKQLYTLQYVMMNVIKSTEARSIIDTSSTQMAKQIQTIQDMAYQPPTPQVIKMAIMAVVTFPLLFIYPFFQKYFVKGMLTGAVKA